MKICVYNTNDGIYITKVLKLIKDLELQSKIKRLTLVKNSIWLLINVTFDFSKSKSNEQLNNGFFGNKKFSKIPHHPSYFGCGLAWGFVPQNEWLRFKEQDDSKGH